MPQVTMPQLGEGVEEGTIGKWLKQVGDAIRVGDPLVEVVTDKVNAEVPSPFAGTLTKILVSEGETIQNDAPIAEVEGSEAESAGSDPSSAAPDTAEVPQQGEGPGTGTREAVASDTGATPEDSASSDPGSTLDTHASDDSATTDTTARLDTDDGATPGENTAPDDREGTDAAPDAGAAAAARPSSLAPPAALAQAPTEATDAALAAATPAPTIPADVRMTPAVRRLARDLRVDVTAITGSGIGGRITRSDIEQAAAGATNGAAPRPATAAAAPTSADSPVREGDSLKKLSPMRKAIANHMAKFLDVPTAYITFEVDMTPVVRSRTAINDQYKAREGISLSYVAYMTMACVEALRKHHDLNAHWTDEGHWRRKDINIGIAVAVEDGLVVPVIKHADTLSLHGLNVAINDLAKRARSKKLAPADLEGGTFTVDNTGWTGSVLTLPIINVPEVAIITMEKIVKRPVVLEDQGDAIAVRSMMNICIAIDHRATDGAQAGEFLADVQRWLESVDEHTPVW
jgi:2-oxoglutarate dehydrogenase E2 component (dihydrolipoamide succinyltransferase)